MKRRLTAYLLCLTLLLTMSACGDKPHSDDTTTAATTTPSETTVPPLTELDHYRQAAERLLNAQELKLTITETTAATTGGETFDYTCGYDITYTGLGTESFGAEVEQSIDYCGNDYQYTERFADGIAFLDLDSSLYCQTMTAEEFLDRFYPLCLVDGAKYGEITSKSNGSDTVYTFSAPTENEAWLAGAELTLLDATATETSGRITGYTYDYTYTAGGTTTKSSLSVEITYSDSPVELTTPDITLYTEIEDLSAPIYLHQGILALDVAESKSFSSTTNLVSYVSSEIYMLENTIDSYGSGEDLVLKQTTTVTPHDLLGIEKKGYTQETVVRDGMATYTEDDGEPETFPASSTLVDASLKQNLHLFLVDPSMLSGASVEVTGAGILVRFTGNDACGADMEQQICADFFGGPNVLTDEADSYVTESLEGYLALDLYSMLPTAYSVDFTGIHTFDGAQYPLTLQYNISMDMASISSYYNATDEHLPTEAPETAPTPVFYKVTDDAGHTMWLFGTIHVGDSRTAYLPQEIWDAFDAADALAVEFDGETFIEELENDPELQKLMAEAYSYPDGSTIDTHLTMDEELYELAVAAMQASGNYTYYTDYFKPFIWSDMLESFYLRQGHSLTSQQGMDEQLMERARNQEKKILDVESGEMQLQMLSGYSDRVQEYMLASSVYTTQDAYLKSVQELFEMWCRGDEAQLIEYLNEEDDTSEMTEEELAIYEEYNEAMLTSRNVDMLKVAQDYLASGETVFYAVGLAHLLGMDGLVDALRNAGYTVELVTYAQ